jgi:hypothetical protein
VTAAQKALDALEAAGNQASARPWSNEEVPTQIGSCHMIGPFLPRGTVGSAACIYVDHRGVGCESPKAVMLRANADLIVAAVNLAAPLAAVVRAAMAGYASGGFDRALDRNDEGDQWAHQLVAALDAFNAAAQEMFGKETT